MQQRVYRSVQGTQGQNNYGLRMTNNVFFNPENRITNLSMTSLVSWQLVKMSTIYDYSPFMVILKSDFYCTPEPIRMSYRERHNCYQCSTIICVINKKNHFGTYFSNVESSFIWISGTYIRSDRLWAIFPIITQQSFRYSSFNHRADAMLVWDISSH